MQPVPRNTFSHLSKQDLRVMLITLYADEILHGSEWISFLWMAAHHLKHNPSKFELHPWRCHVMIL